MSASDTGFWKDLVPRFARSHEFVWNMVVCISSLLEHVPYGSLTTVFDAVSAPVITNHQHRHALQFYNKAITHVRDLAERDDMDDSIALLSCVLFATVEFQQRNIKTGRDLVERGCRILIQILSQQRASPTSLAIQQVVGPFVLRKAVLMATLGTVLPAEWIANVQSSSALQMALSRLPALNEARVQFHSLVYHCYEVIRVAELVPEDDPNDPGLQRFVLTRRALLEKLLNWKTIFQRDWSPTPDPEAGWMHSYISMYWAVCYVSLATCSSRLEATYDQYREHFLDIVHHAEVYLHCAAKSTTDQQTLKLDPGCVPPLYFCSMKCRDPVLRRKALELMRVAPQPTSRWAFITPDRVAEKVILKEEGRDRLYTSVEMETSEVGVWPPEHRRYTHTSVFNRQLSGGRERLAVQLSRFTPIPNSQRTQLVHDYIWLDEREDDIDLRKQIGKTIGGLGHMTEMNSSDLS
ncbi:hypothetical protein H2204_002870 [Knufia peltigerae]|uniref:C6 zinc finger domain protein n=1 Tax=Knufia peltigerae TaxID=1002370 RepID=A0AA38YBV0_9EURO|nr:hypothetical protein H2204_002870 [Knufia peltigerae]